MTENHPHKSPRLQSWMLEGSIGSITNRSGKVSVSASTEESPFVIIIAIITPENIPEVDPLQQVSIPELLKSGYALSTLNWRTAQLNNPVISVLHDHIKPSAKLNSGQTLDGAVTFSRDRDKFHLPDGVLYKKHPLAVRSVDK